ncbi:MAG: orotidine-5'-phosphate decarboxylase [Campylobacterales bacterium]|nr:orotidine-5'-phosphate decarboxylase [Campylobacterales bacterium]
MKLCVALDLPSKDENLALLNELKGFDIWIKVGFRSFIRDGREFLREIKKIDDNFKIFLDLKLYDIPNTMADAAEEIANLGVDMFNIHASSGEKAMMEVMNRLEKFKNRPIVLAVTALTSFNKDDFYNIYKSDLNDKAVEFAKLANKSNLDGVVCSAYESKNIKLNTKNEFLTLTPGIRPFDEESNDQERVANLTIAKEQNIDFIVVGRPIYKATNSKNIVENILKNIQ